MTQPWLSRVLPIAAIYSFRMLGLFMLIPVFSVAATSLNGATPTLIGIALGSYGLSQGILQMPFGFLSDRFGRKPLLTIGLLLFALGSIFGALTESVYGMIIARTLQGTGAIGSVLMALMGDLTPDEHRTKSMAIIGVTIGISFSLAMVISPAITHRFGLAGIFYLTAILASMGLVMLHTIIPTPKKEPFQIDNELNRSRLKTVYKNLHLQRLNAGIFCLHLILTSTFFAIPLMLQQQIKLGHLTLQWHFYLPLMLCAFLVMLPFIMLAEKKQTVKPVFLGAVAATAIAQLILAFTYTHWLSICGLMFVYFVAFNILEASLPSLVSRQANASSKGAAMGMYSSCQFLGIFTGGAMSGIIYQHFGHQGIFLINAVIALIWFCIAMYMKPNLYQLTLRIDYHTPHKDEAGLIQSLLTLPGIHDAIIAHDEGIIYLRINKMTYQHGSAELLINTIHQP